MSCSPPDEKDVSLGRIMTLYSRNVQIYCSSGLMTSHGTSALRNPWSRGLLLIEHISRDALSYGSSSLRPQHLSCGRVWQRWAPHITKGRDSFVGGNGHLSETRSSVLALPDPEPHCGRASRGRERACIPSLCCDSALPWRA